jgi:hypothetical protein
LIPNADQADGEGDGVGDACDSCLAVKNSRVGGGGAGLGTQPDLDGDGCGNACDCDFDQDGTCGGSDFNTFRICFARAVGPGTGPAADPTCAEADMNGNGVVGGPDFNLFRLGFGMNPGLSQDPSRAGDATCP